MMLLMVKNFEKALNLSYLLIINLAPSKRQKKIHVVIYCRKHLKVKKKIIKLNYVHPYTTGVDEPYA